MTGIKTALPITQLPSVYLLRGGKHTVEYKFKVTCPLHEFTQLKNLWDEALDTTCVNFNEDFTEASFLQVSDSRAQKFSDKSLQFIFEDLIYLKTNSGVVCPERFKVTSY